MRWDGRLAGSHSARLSGEVEEYHRGAVPSYNEKLFSVCDSYMHRPSVVSSMTNVPSRSAILRADDSPCLLRLQNNVKKPIW